MHLLIDIGGTKTRLAVSRNLSSFTEPTVIPTPANFNEAIAAITKIARQMTDNKLITSIAIGVPGPLDKNKTMVHSAPNLPGWHQQPLKKKLEQELNTTVYIQNDADLVGLGEATKGAGLNYSIIVYLTVSTGVGGTRIVNKKIDRHAIGFEPGHLIIDLDNSIYPNQPSALTTLEDLAGGASLECRLGQSPPDIEDDALWEELAGHLAVGINNILVLWSPDVVVIGGPMMKDIKIDSVARELAKISSFLPEIPPLKPAQLKDTGGLHGALAYLQQII